MGENQPPRKEWNRAKKAAQRGPVGEHLPMIQSACVGKRQRFIQGSEYRPVRPKLRKGAEGAKAQKESDKVRPPLKVTKLPHGFWFFGFFHHHFFAKRA